MGKIIDESWEKLILKYNILDKVKDHGFFVITSDQIKEVYEPRLITKFDKQEDLPEIFKKNNLSIMPISRGEYYISNHQMFKKLDDISSDIEKVDLPAYIQSIDKDNINSEAIALNCSYLTGMISDFVGDTEIYPTVSGRMSSKKFDFLIDNVMTDSKDFVRVENSQIEIDGAYEGCKYLSIVEAKKTMIDNFLIRQLYYPYRLWKSKVNKEIKLIYFIHSNGIFSFFEYKFMRPNDYNSIQLIKQKNYTLDDIAINTEQIQNILNSVPIINEPNIPFPQADTFSRVINLCEYVKSGPKSKSNITIHYAFADRQTDYYGNACEYLGLIEKEHRYDGVYYKSSSEGKRILELSYVKRQLAFTEKILQHKVFNECLRHYFSNAVINNDDIIRIMKESNLYNIDSDKTYERRARTIRKWIDWIVNLIQE